MQPRRGVSQVFTTFCWRFSLGKAKTYDENRKMERLEIEHFKFKDKTRRCKSGGYD